MKTRKSTQLKSGVVAATALALAAAAAPVPAEGVSPRVGKADFYVGLGSFRPQSDSKLTGRTGKYSFAAGGGARHSQHIAWEVEFLYFSQDVDTPAALKNAGFLTSVSGNAHINTWGIGGIAKWIQPLGPLDVYAGAGAGYYSSELKAQVRTLFFASDYVKRSDKAAGTQVVAGVDLPLSDTAIWSVQYRKLFLDMDFGPGIGGVSVGGAMWQLSFRKFF